MRLLSAPPLPNALKKENTEYESINLMDHDTIPEDAACLVINGATGDFPRTIRRKWSGIWTGAEM